MPKRMPPGCVEDRDRHGNIRIYYRTKGAPKVRLDKAGAPFTLAFMRAYEAAVAGDTLALPPGERSPIDRSATPDTWRWLVLRYFRSADFQRMAELTRRNRRSVLEMTLVEPVRLDSPDTFAGMPLKHFTAKAVRVLRDRKAATPAAANNRLKAIAGVCRFAVDEEIMEANPVPGVRRFKLASGGHHTWSEDEIRQFEARWPLGTKARLALDIFVYTGFRRSDAVAVGRQHVSTQAGGQQELHYILAKNRAHNPVTVDIPLLAPLAASIEAARAAGQCGDLTFLVTEYGKPHTANGFGSKFKMWCRAASLPHCSAHGLRKASACIAAENGATEYELMAIYGWSDAATAAHYVRKANRTRMAGKAGALIKREQNSN